MSFYTSLATEFEARIADLRPTEAYASIRQMAVKLARHGAEISAELPMLVEPNPRTRNRMLLNELQRAYSRYADGAPGEAFEVAHRVKSAAVAGMDPLAEIDALHLIGRINYDENRLSEAEECFAEEMDRALGFSVVPAFFRAVHEASRVRSSLFDLLQAEFGFRFARDYYTARMMLAGPSASNDDAPGSDLQNAGAAIRSLRALSESYVLFERGPKEADALIERLASPHFSLRDESGAVFLEARGLATACIGSIPKHQGILARLASRAMALHRVYPQMSSFMLEEAEYVADLRGDAFPRAFRRVLANSSEAQRLKSAPFYKPSAGAIPPAASSAPYTTPAGAAEDASVLYQYLKEFDGQGRYVYRGQTAHYAGPLLPSAFRPILAEKYGRTTRSNDAGLSGPVSLRKCGKVFYGEYNWCFQQYANPVSHLIDRDASPEKVNTAELLYRRILDDPGIAFAQEGKTFVPWIEALRNVLSPEEYDLFSENKNDWMLRINNYHRRLYRMDRFVALFGYTLGTTIAQQYGFSSEGLDATKNIDVAFFFATRDSVDFRTLVKDGIGVIYRIPFPGNDIAEAPLTKYDYYTLPSIVDVNDVIYRFELEGLGRTESRTCVDTYAGASLIDGFQDLDLFVLPEGFYGTTRVAKQDAVIIFPDEIREDYFDREPGVDGIRFPKYRFVEDLATREGVQQFYFRHTGKAPSSAAIITREELWPRDDFLLEAVVRIILGSYRLRTKHAKRPELIDVGFDNDAFAKESSERYWADRPIFFTEYEKLGARFGAKTL